MGFRLRKSAHKLSTEFFTLWRKTFFNLFERVFPSLSLSVSVAIEPFWETLQGENGRGSKGGSGRLEMAGQGIGGSGLTDRDQVTTIVFGAGTWSWGIRECAGRTIDEEQIEGGAKKCPKRYPR